MHAPLRIEVPDETNADALCRLLRPFGVEAIAVNGHFEVRVELIARSPERRVVDALNAIDRWLPTAAISFVRVHLDGRTYTLHAPPGETPA
jgi:hypothetical protein